MPKSLQSFFLTHFIANVDSSNSKYVFIYAHIVVSIGNCEVVVSTANYFQFIEAAGGEGGARVRAEVGRALRPPARPLQAALGRGSLH